VFRNTIINSKRTISSNNSMSKY